MNKTFGERNGEQNMNYCLNNSNISRGKQRNRDVGKSAFKRSLRNLGQLKGEAYVCGTMKVK